MSVWLLAVLGLAVSALAVRLLPVLRLIVCRLAVWRLPVLRLAAVLPLTVSALPVRLLSGYRCLFIRRRLLARGRPLLMRGLRSVIRSLSGLAVIGPGRLVLRVFGFVSHGAIVSYLCAVTTEIPPIGG